MSDIKTGFIADTPDERDLTFGSDNSLVKKFGAEVLCPNSDWSPWLPDGELQAENYETNGCVSYNTLNCIEILKKRIADVSENLSDRFVAKNSGTDPNHGNNPRKVADTIKKGWSVYEYEYPRPATLQEFYAEIPKKLEILAKGRGAEYEFGYEPKVAYKDIREALKYSPLGISVPAWFKDESGSYYRPTGQNDTHWCVCYGILPNGDLLVFDSYYPFRKILRADVVPSTIYSYYLKKQVSDMNAFQRFFALLEKVLYGLFVGEKPVYPDDVPHETSTSPLADPVPAPKYEWDTPEKARHSVRVICDEEGLSVKDKNELCATVGAESGWKPRAIGKPNTNGTRDYGICQINDYWWIGDKKQFPSIEYVLDNPEACIRWMCGLWKAGKKTYWAAYTNKSYLKFM